MKRKPDISIIIPAYNTETFIGPCLDSIIRQDGAPDFEIIVIDDGSTDNTAQIVKEYALQYGNIQLIRQKNRGVSLARNAGLERAQGRFVSFVDADDMVGADYAHIAPAFESTPYNSNKDIAHWTEKNENLHMSGISLPPQIPVQSFVNELSSEYFTNMLAPMRDDKIDIAMGGKITLNVAKNSLSRYVYETEHVYGRDMSDKKIMFTHAYMRESANFALFRRNFLNRMRLRFVPHMNLDEDITFTQLAVIYARKIITVPNSLYLYNRHENTLSNMWPPREGVTERAMALRHALILQNLRKRHKIAQLYCEIVKEFSSEESYLMAYPQWQLPIECVNCDRKTCRKCPKDDWVYLTIDDNIYELLTLRQNAIHGR